MKKVTLIFLSLFFLKAQAQKNPTWQIVFEVNGLTTNSPSTVGPATNYSMVDSNTNLFKKYNYESGYTIKTKLKIGASGGIRFNYSVAKNLFINIGFLISHYSIEKTNNYNYKFLDSSLVTLQRTAVGWNDPTNGQTILFYGGAGAVISGSGGFTLAPGFYTTSTNRKYSSDKINFTAIDIPLSAEYKINGSRFSVNGEISPIFLLNSSVATNYEPDPEIRFINTSNYKLNSLLWRFGAGITYKINDNLEAGLNFKRTINSILVVYEKSRINSVGLQLHFSLPSKK